MATGRQALGSSLIEHVIEILRPPLPRPFLRAISALCVVPLSSGTCRPCFFCRSRNRDVGSARNFASPGFALCCWAAGLVGHGVLFAAAEIATWGPPETSLMATGRQALGFSMAASPQTTEGWGELGGVAWMNEGGHLVLDDVRMYNNWVQVYGAVIVAQRATITVRNSQIYENGVSGWHGIIRIGSAVTFAILRTQIFDNRNNANLHGMLDLYGCYEARQPGFPRDDCGQGAVESVDFWGSGGAAISFLRREQGMANIQDGLVYPLVMKHVRIFENNAGFPAGGLSDFGGGIRARAIPARSAVHLALTN